MPPVEPNRLGHELTDGAVSRMHGGLHEETLSGRRGCQRVRRFTVKWIVLASPWLPRLSTALARTRCLPGRADFTVNRASSEGGGTVPATIYVMNDAVNLYIAIKVTNATVGGSDFVPGGIPLAGSHDSVERGCSEPAKDDRFGGRRSENEHAGRDRGDDDGDLNWTPCRHRRGR